MGVRGPYEDEEPEEDECEEEGWDGNEYEEEYEDDFEESYDNGPEEEIIWDDEMEAERSREEFLRRGSKNIRYPKGK